MGDQDHHGQEMEKLVDKSRLFEILLDYDNVKYS